MSEMEVFNKLAKSNKRNKMTYTFFLEVGLLYKAHTF